ncbi:MAG: GntR family transcriptional regulator [Victivallaceae bacterium]|nr:GntR family transcriptional regulator [Victivallaceae bacterium]
MKRGKPKKYPALAEEIRRYIRERKLKNNAGLPSERRLAQMFEVSHLTVRKALRLLEQERLIYKEPSRGNFVGTRPYSGRDGQLVGLLFPDHELFYYNIFADLEERLFAAGLHPVVHLTHNSRKKEEDILDFVREGRFAALLAVPNPACAGKYAQLSLPLICFDISLPELDIPQVISADYEGAVTAARHLLSLGHTAVAHIGSMYDRTAELRRQGLADTLGQAGVELPEYYLKVREPTRQWGYAAATELFALKNPPTAIFCGNDTIAAGVRRYCSEHKISVPGQCSLVGFGDIAVAQDLNLTSVSQHTEAIAAALWNLLRLRLNGEDIPGKTVIPTSLVWRGSTAKVL